MSLHAEIKPSNAAKIEILLAFGADVNEIREGMTPLDLAAFQFYQNPHRSWHDTVETLLKAGARFRKCSALHYSDDPSLDVKVEMMLDDLRLGTSAVKKLGLRIPRYLI